MPRAATRARPHACASLLKPGGTLVYSTCSLEPEENEQLVEQHHRAPSPSCASSNRRRTLPFVDDVDGAFAAKFVRE